VLVAGWKVFDVFLIGTLQAFIFFLLTIIYFGMAVEGSKEHGEETHEKPAASPVTSPAVSQATSS
jgi:F-type H+-transporting ATPase subunit a